MPPKQQKLTPAAWAAIGVITAALLACCSGVTIAAIQIFPDVLPAIFPPTNLPPTAMLSSTEPLIAIQPTSVPPTAAIPSPTMPPTIDIPVPPSITPTNTPEEIRFTVTILNVASGNSYSYFTDTLQVGATVYSDRDYVYSTIPSFLDSKIYIATPNADLFSTGTNFLTFSINQDAVVYVAYDDRYATKPSWLNSFQDMGADLEYSWTGGIIKLSLYGKQFPKGQVVLGGNVSPGENANHGMYTVVISEK